jgi:hypothetical protein
MNYNKYLLIIVIGLPYSGKTEYCKNNINQHILYDDFIPYFYDGRIIDDLINKRKIVINDPRLCNFNTFKLFIEIFEEYISKKNILLILFENNKEKCINNIKLSNRLNINVTDNIICTSKIYNIKLYNDYNNIIILIYT